MPTLCNRYNNRFATTLARFIRSQCADETTRVAFLCCPTAFVGFQHTNPLPETRLLEFDSRFALLDPRRFVKYDLDEPDHIPESLKGTVDICVADPPFLNEVRFPCLVAPLHGQLPNATP